MPSTEDKSLVDGMYRRLRRDIIEGRLHAGAKLKLKGLAEEYDVGRSPLREALSRLIGESLVVAHSQRGFWVAPISVQEFDDLTRSRFLIECEALSLSICNGNNSWRGRVNTAFEELSQIERPQLKPILAPDPQQLDEWEKLNDAFHFALIDACGSPTLIKMREWLHYQLERYRRISVGVSISNRNVHEEHAAIHEAAIERRVLQACRLMKLHLRETSTAVRQAMQTTAAATVGLTA